MASNTPNLGLLKKDPVTDGADTFNIEEMLNKNWDKVDEAVGTHTADETKHIGTETKTSPVDADSVALVDSEAGGKLKKLSLSNLKTFLGNVFALITHSHAWSAIAEKPTAFTPSSHASSATTYGKGDSSCYGHLKLSSSYTSTSSTTSGYAATPSAVKAAYDKAVSAYNQANGGAKVEIGSYTGTGTHGSANPNSLTFSFEPKFVVVVNRDAGDYHLFLVRNATSAISRWDDFSVSDKVKLTWSGNSVSWYNDVYVESWQLNRSGIVYDYVAFG